MGRRRAASRDEILAKATAIFREQGFARSSADILVARIGVSRYSIYAEFGNKLGLFEAALAQYNKQVIDKRFGPLDGPDAGLDAILALFEHYGNAGNGPAAGRGCLLCNSAVEFGPDDPTGKQVFQNYFKRLSASFENALQNARAAGQLPATCNTAAEAAFLTSAVLGLFVLIRAKAPAAVIKQAADAAAGHVQKISGQSA